MENPNWTLSRADFDPYRRGADDQDACETTDTESNTSSVGTEPIEHSTPIPSSTSSTESSDENFIQLLSISHKRSKSGRKKKQGAKMRRQGDSDEISAAHPIEAAAANRENYPTELTLTSCSSRPSRSREVVALSSSSSSQRFVRYFSSQATNHQE